MKLYILSVVVIMFTFHYSSEAAKANARFYNSAHPGKCVLDGNNILSPGQSGKVPGHPCAGVTCVEESYAEFKTCPAVAPPKGCKMRDFANINRSYPECCERTYDCKKKV